MNKIKDGIDDITILNGKIMRVKAGKNGNCVVKIESASEDETLYRFRFTYLITEKPETMPSNQEIMFVPKDKFLEKGEIYYWKSWEDFILENKID